MRMRRFGDGRQIARIAEEIGRLHDDAARLVVDRSGDVLARVGSGARRTIPSPAICASVAQTSAYCGCRPPEITALLRCVRRCAISIASPQAVEPSYIEALATSMPVSAATWVWNSNRTCSVPLRDFRLIGRVAGQELRALDEMIDARRDVAPIGAGAEKERHRPGRDAAARHRASSPARPPSRSWRSGMSSRPVDPLVGGNVGEQRARCRRTPMRVSMASRSMCVERQIAHDDQPRVLR